MILTSSFSLSMIGREYFLMGAFVNFIWKITTVASGFIRISQFSTCLSKLCTFLNTLMQDWKLQ